MKQRTFIAISAWLLSSASMAQMPINAPPAPDIKNISEEDGTDALSEKPGFTAKVPDESARYEMIYRANLGRADDIKLLVSHGGSPNQTTGEGMPVLSLAAGRRDPEGINVVKMLVNLGADVNARDRKGQTALFNAAKQGSIETLNFLLSKDIDYSAIDNNGDDARIVAFRNGRNDSMKAIDEFIVKHPTPVSKAASPPVAASASTASPTATVEDVPLMQPKMDPTPPPADLPSAEEKLADMKKNKTSREEIKRMQQELAAANEQSVMEESKSQKKLNKKNPNAKAAAKAAAASANEGFTPEQLDPAVRKDFDKLASDLAFSTCAFQYWSFCSDVRQSTDLESEELTVAIMSNHAKVDDLKDTLFSQFRISPQTYNNIMDSAQQRIYNQLNNMPSNRYRHEMNVGKMDDMYARCGEISRQWAVKPPGIKKRHKIRGNGSQRPGQMQDDSMDDQVMGDPDIPDSSNGVNGRYNDNSM